MRENILGRLRALRSDTREAIESLTILRWRVEEVESQFESPRAVLEYLDGFIDLFGRQAEGLDRLVAEAEAEVLPSLATRLRRFGASSAVHEQGCREFSDRWVQKPLPYEEVRPLLVRVVADVRGQLERIRGLEDVAALIESPTDQVDVDGRYDRRALFSRFADPLRRRRQGDD